MASIDILLTRAESILAMTGSDIRSALSAGIAAAREGQTEAILAATFNARDIRFKARGQIAGCSLRTPEPGHNHYADSAVENILEAVAAHFLGRSEAAEGLLSRARDAYLRAKAAADVIAEVEMAERCVRDACSTLHAAERQEYYVQRAADLAETAGRVAQLRNFAYVLRRKCRDAEIALETARIRLSKALDRL